MRNITRLLRYSVYLVKGSFIAESGAVVAVAVAIVFALFVVFWKLVPATVEYPKSKK
jgi:hypothetical protein